jgi:PBSX family phage portal protein
VDGKKVFFKEFGDPRYMSKRTGKYYEKEHELNAAVAGNTDNDGPATEVLHYKIPALRGAYGFPRWIGNLLSVLGSRLSEEVNYFYFKNKGIPPFMIFVENGRLQSGAVDRLRDFLEQTKGDTSKFWRIAILEGESADDARKRNVQWGGNVRFKIQKLMSEQLKDALFQEYDDRNRDKVGESFRLPRLLRGDVRDFNRATSETAKALAEEQIFQPERDRFDSWINRVIGPVLNMRYWEFKSLAPVIHDPYALTEMLSALVKANVIVPAEARQIAAEIFNREFAEIDAPWAKVPLSVYLKENPGQGEVTENFKEFTTSLSKQIEQINGGTGEDTAGLLDKLKEMRRVLILSRARNSS